nr:immunoglobulin heavy chain junction region [Mus musculus]
CAREGGFITSPYFDVW